MAPTRLKAPSKCSIPASRQGAGKLQAFGQQEQRSLRDKVKDFKA
jgi:hypothetical protein